MRSLLFSTTLLVALGISHSASAAAVSCQALATSLAIPNTKVLSANVERPGAFLPPNLDASKPEAAAYKKLPAFCRVQLEAHPSADSQIAIEVWLPLADWNGKFRGQGNGGFAGSLDYRGMAYSLSMNYATAATDTGHEAEATDAAWAYQHPEKVIDFGYRGLHVMTEDAKQTIEKFYGKPSEKNYFDSCSDGGREALMEAQRFPGDYDGILAGAPANYWTRLITAGLGAEKTLLRSEQTYIPLNKTPAINAAVLASCDALDGVRDGIITYQQRCHFNPEVLLCKGADNDSCLTRDQVQSLKAIYGGTKDAHGRLIFPPIQPGGETGDGGWKYWVLGESYQTSEGLKYPVTFFRNMVYEDPNWDFKTANLDDALATADKKVGHALNAIDPDLSAFQKRGGKLILYHGWLDAAISPLNTIDYYREVTDKMGASDVNGFLRLYMVPGMQHCAGGPGPYLFGQLGIAVQKDPAHNAFSSLVDWVELDKTPGPILASKLVDDHDPSKGVLMTRPLCPFPQVGVYNGSGDPNQAASFTCQAPVLQGKGGR